MLVKGYKVDPGQYQRIHDLVARLPKGCVMYSEGQPYLTLLKPSRGIHIFVGTKEQVDGFEEFVISCENSCKKEDCTQEIDAGETQGDNYVI